MVFLLTTRLMEKTLARCALKSEVKKARAIFWSSVVKKSAASGAEVDMPLFDDLYDSDDDTDLTKASIEWVVCFFFCLMFI